ncbi:MAG: glycosyltransferase [Cetobacterium sp.]
MSKKIVVDVLLITYNHEKYIKKCIESILNQEIGNLKVNLVIGEDNSPDKTREILKKYAKSNQVDIRLLFRKKNLGPIGNFCSSLRVCQGDYIVFIEGDDFFSDRTIIKRGIEFLEKNKNFSAVCHSEEVIDLNEKTMYINSFDKIIRNPVEFIEKNNIPTLGLTFRNYCKNEREEFEKLFFNNIYIADYQLKCYLLTKGYIKYFDIIATKHRLIYNTTSFASQSNLLKAEDYRIALKNTKYYYNKVYKTFFDKIFEELIVRSYFPTIKLNLKLKKYEKLLEISDKKLIFKYILKILYKKYRGKNEN